LAGRIPTELRGIKIVPVGNVKKCSNSVAAANTRIPNGG